METDHFTQIFTNPITKNSKLLVLWSAQVDAHGQMVYVLGWKLKLLKTSYP